MDAVIQLRLDKLEEKVRANSGLLELNDRNMWSALDCLAKGGHFWYVHSSAGDTIIKRCKCGAQMTMHRLSLSRHERRALRTLGL